MGLQDSMEGSGGGRWVGFRTACGAIVQACRHRLMFARLLPFTLPCCGPPARCCGAGRGAALWLEEDDMMRLGWRACPSSLPMVARARHPHGGTARIPLLRYRETDFGPKSSEASVDLPAPTAVGGCAGWEAISAGPAQPGGNMNNSNPENAGRLSALGGRSAQLSGNLHQSHRGVHGDGLAERERAYTSASAEHRRHLCRCGGSLEGVRVPAGIPRAQGRSVLEVALFLPGQP